MKESLLKNVIAWIGLTAEEWAIQREIEQSGITPIQIKYIGADPGFTTDLIELTSIAQLGDLERFEAVLNKMPDNKKLLMKSVIINFGKENLFK